MRRLTPYTNPLDTPYLQAKSVDWLQDCSLDVFQHFCSGHEGACLNQQELYLILALFRTIGTALRNLSEKKPSVT